MTNKQLKFLLLGGTGAMGVHLANILIAQGHDVSITTRKKDRVSKDHLRYIKGNARDNEFLINMFTSNDYDVCVDFMSYTTDEFRQRVELLLSSVGQYVYLSSSRVYSNVDEIITERTPRLLDVSNDKDFLSTDEYSLTKARQEDLLINSKYSNWTIIRPYITYSEDRFQLGVMEKEQWLYRAVKGRTIVFSDDITKHYTTMTYGKDVANGIASICGKKNTMGEIFNITSQETIKWEDILNIYTETLSNYYKITIPVRLCPFSMYLKYPSIQYQVKYDRYFDRKFDNSKINQYIDTSRFVLVKDGLRSCLLSFLCNPHFKNFDLRGEVIRDTITKEVANKKEFVDLKRYCIYIMLRYIFPKSIL